MCCGVSCGVERTWLTSIPPIRSFVSLRSRVPRHATIASSAWPAGERVIPPLATGHDPGSSPLRRVVMRSLVTAA